MTAGAAVVRTPSLPAATLDRHAGRVSVWASGVALSVSSALVLVLLSRHLTPHEITQTSGVFVLALLVSVPAVAVQGQAAACRAQTGERARLAPRPVAAGVGLLLCCSPAVALLGHLPLPAVVFSFLMLLPALVANLARGTLLGDGELAPVARSQAVEAVVRAVLAVVLGWTWGAGGMALGLLLGSIVGAATLGRPQRGTAALRLTTVLLGLGTFTAVVNIDVLGATTLVPHDASGYATSALPGKAVFLTLMAAGWLLVPVAAGWTGLRPALRAVGTCLAAGLVLALLATAGAPLAETVLGQPHGPLLSSGLVALAMAVAGGSWAGLMILVGRGAGSLWVPSAVCLGVLLPVVLLERTATGLALGTLLGQVAALAVLLLQLRRELPGVHGRSAG